MPCRYACFGFLVGLVLSAGALAQDRSLFEGTTADLWLLDQETGQVTGYNNNAWTTDGNPANFPFLSLDGSDALLINRVPYSSTPMTPGQPAISLVGIGAAAISLGEGGVGGHRNLTISPDNSGPYTDTIAVNINVSSALLETDEHELQIVVTQSGAGVIQDQVVTLAISSGETGQNGYVTQTIYLVDNGNYTVDAILRKGPVEVASEAAAYELVIDPTRMRRDTDGDGIPDAVELDIGLNPLGADWDADLDNNGWSEFDEWLRRYCLDPNTLEPLDTAARCLDGNELPIDSDKDDWTDFDEILRGTNHLDPEPELIPGSTGVGTGGELPVYTKDFTEFGDINFCTDGTTFYFDLKFYAEATWFGDPRYDIIFGIGGDRFPFGAPVEVIRANWDENGAITRASPAVNSFPDNSVNPPVVPPDRWLDGPISDFTIEQLEPSSWHVYGSVAVGTEPFAPGDELSTVAIRSGASGDRSIGSFVVSADPGDCSGNIASPSNGRTEFEALQMARFKDFPAANRLYEVEYVVAAGMGNLVVPGSANLGSVSWIGSGAVESVAEAVVVQSFVPVEDNLAGIDVMLAPGEEAGKITFRVWGGALRDGELLVDQTLGKVRPDSSANRLVEFRFEPVAVQPGQPVFLEFRQSVTGLVTTGEDSYPAGALIEEGGNAGLNDPDLVMVVFHDTNFANGTGGTRLGMQWWNLAVGDLGGGKVYEGDSLLRDEEITAAGLTPADIASRRQMSQLQAALLNDKLPEMRLPASQSLVINAAHRFEPAVADFWELPAGYTRMYKGWLPRRRDVTPIDMLVEQGEGTWDTPDQWRREFVAYLVPRLVVPAAPSLDIDSTINVAVIEAGLSQESRIEGAADLQLFTQVFQPGQPVFLLQSGLPQYYPQTDVFYPGTDIFYPPSNVFYPGTDVFYPGQPVFYPQTDVFVKQWEENLERLARADRNLDQSILDAGIALGQGMPLEQLGVWMKRQFYAAEPGSQSDIYLGQQLLRSFDDGCQVYEAFLPDLQANTNGWNEFLDRCPVWFTENELSTKVAQDADRQYQVRLSLLPGAAVAIANTPTLLDRAIDSDADGIVNNAEVNRSIRILTLPWVEDADGDLIVDGNDLCPNDPLDECSSNPVLPLLTTDIDFQVYEPESASEPALIAIQLERIYDKPVEVFYQAVVANGDSATAGEDFEPISGSVIIAPGQLSALIAVPVFADALDEGAETFSLIVSGADYAVVGDDGIIQISLNDTLPVGAPPSAILAQSSFVVDERTSVQFDASPSFDPAGQNLNFSWQQVDSSGVLVSLLNPATAQPSFDAPETLNSLSLRFEVTVTNEDSQTAVAEATVQVNPINDPPVLTGLPSYQVIIGNTLTLADAALLAFVDDPESDPLAIGAIVVQPAFGTLTDTGSGFDYTSNSSLPALAADQVSTGAVTGGYNSPVVQTFIPQAINTSGIDNLAGVDARLIGTGAFSSDVTLNVWINTALRLGDPLVSVTLQDVPRNTDLEFRFAPVFVVPGVEYALEFVIADALVMGAIIPGNYANGAVTEGGGNLFNGAADLLFTTYSDPDFDGTPDNVDVLQLSSPRVVDWAVSGDGRTVILQEIDDSPQPAEHRVVAFSLQTGQRTVLLNKELSGFFPSPQEASAVWFNTGTPGVDEQLHRYDPDAAQPFASIPMPETMPTFLYWDTAVDPRFGDLHYCSRETGSDTEQWYRINNDDLSTATYGFDTCRGSNNMAPVRIGQRFCVLFGFDEIRCTDPGSGGRELGISADPFTGNSWGNIFSALGLNGDSPQSGIEQVGDSALLFMSRDQFATPVEVEVYLITEDSWTTEILPGPGGDEIYTFLAPTVLMNRSIVDIFTDEDRLFRRPPEVQALPGGGAAITFATAGLPATGDEFIEMWKWDGNPNATGLEPIDIGVIPGALDSGGYASSHAGKMQNVGGKLYWQVQGVVNDQERYIYEVDTSGAPNALTLLQTVSGTLNDVPPHQNERAPYDILVAGPNTAGVLIDGAFPDVCKIVNIVDASVAQENVECSNHETVDGAGLLFEDSLEQNLFFLGIGIPRTGITSFSVEVTDTGGNSVELPVQVEVLPPL